jgi:hypothetical protein
MAEARSRERWNHTAALLALLANCHRDPRRRRPYRPDDFLPTPPARPTPVPITDLSILKAVFIDRRIPEVLP